MWMYTTLLTPSQHPINTLSTIPLNLLPLGQNVDVYQARKMLDSKTTQQTEQGNYYHTPYPIPFNLEHCM